MAFNPFHAFRKHQRPLIAALAIFCMVLFVIQFGYGRSDPINRLLGLIGAGRGKGQLVATLHGRKVTEGDLSQLRRDRELATEYLAYVARTGAMLKISKALQEQMGRRGSRDNPPGEELSRALFAWSFFTQQGQRLPRKYALQGLQAARVEKVRMSRTNDSEGERSMDELARAFAFLAWEAGRRNQKDFFFGGNSDTADLLDFILWEQQADRLGVVLTEEDVVAAVKREGAGQDMVGGPTLGVDTFTQQFLENNSGVRGATVDQLAQALNREFRVLFAQEAVLGEEGGVRSLREGTLPQVPAAGTPREFLDWYRDKRTTLKVAVLPVPVDRFVKDVQGQPSEKTLRDLYEQYKGVEPVPDRALPGFKEPRRVRAETVTALSDSPFYQREAKAQALGTAAARQAAPVAAGLFGGPLVGAAAATWPLAYDPLRGEYERYEAEARSYVDRGFGFGVDVTDRRPLYAAVAGLTAGATPGAPLAAGTGAVAGDTLYRLAAAKVAGSVLAAGAGGSPLAAVGLPLTYRSTVLPPQNVEGQMFAKVVDGLAPRLVTKNLDTVAAELLKLKSRPEEARAYVAKAVKDYGLEHTVMAQPKTSHQLDDDPALQSLKREVDTEERVAALETGAAPADVAKVVLDGVGVYDPQRYPPAGRWDLAKEPFLWWRVEDLPARERPFEAVRGQVEAAWRAEKARSLARAEADRVKAEVEKNVAANHSAAEAEKVLRSHGEAFELDNVARLLPELTPFAPREQPYRAYAPPRERIPHPRADFVDRLMTLKEPGDAVVLRDKPARTFYVAVLEERSDPTRGGGAADLRAFLEEYRLADKAGSLYNQFLDDQRRAYVREVEKQMRIDATGGKVDDQGNIILPEGVSRGGETESGE
jgi:hypothetical protein